MADERAAVGTALELRRVASSVAAVVMAAVLASCRVSAPTDASEGLPLLGSQPEVGAGASAGDGPSQGETASLRADTLYVAAISGLVESTRAVIDSEEAWEEAWTRITSPFLPAPERPSVDFETEQVVVVGLGARPSGGYAIELGSVERADGEVTVTVREAAPGAGCLTTQALSQPVLAFSLATDGDPVRFHEERSTRDCL